MKSKHTHNLKKNSAILALSFVAILIGSLHFFVASAQQVESVIIQYPQLSNDRDPINLVPTTTQIQQNATSINIGPNAAKIIGSEGQPFPRFSGIDTSLWVSEARTAQIFDDTIFWGLTDVKNGLISETQYVGSPFDGNAGGGGNEGGDNGGGGNNPPTPVLCTSFSSITPSSRYFSLSAGAQQFSVTPQPNSFNGEVRWTHLVNERPTGAVITGTSATFRNLTPNSTIRAVATPGDREQCSITFSPSNSLNIIRQTQNETAALTGTDDVLFAFSAQTNSANAQIQIFQPYLANGYRPSPTELTALANSMRIDYDQNSNDNWREIQGVRFNSTADSGTVWFTTFDPLPAITTTPSQFRIRGNICNSTNQPIDLTLHNPSIGGAYGFTSDANTNTYTESTRNPRTIPRCIKPDLVTNNLVLPTNAAPGAVSFRATVQNLDSGIAPPTNTQFRVLNTSNIPVGAPSIVSTGQLVANTGSQNLSTSIFINTPGLYKLEVCADTPANTANESNETNNCATSGYFLVSFPTVNATISRITGNEQNSIYAQYPEQSIYQFIASSDGTRTAGINQLTFNINRPGRSPAELTGAIFTLNSINSAGAWQRVVEGRLINNNTQVVFGPISESLGLVVKQYRIDAQLPCVAAQRSTIDLALGSASNIAYSTNVRTRFTESASPKTVNSCLTGDGITQDEYFAASTANRATGYFKITSGTNGGDVPARFQFIRYNFGRLNTTAQTFFTNEISSGRLKLQSYNSTTSTWIDTEFTPTLNNSGGNHILQFGPVYGTNPNAKNFTITPTGTIFRIGWAASCGLPIGTSSELINSIISNTSIDIKFGTQTNNPFTQFDDTTRALQFTTNIFDPFDIPLQSTCGSRG